jgi:hypothetical protein
MPCKYQKHVKQQEGRIRHLEQELKSAREEICKLKAGNVSSCFMEDISGHWRKPKNSKSRCCRFSANDVSEVKLNNKFTLLATDTLKVNQKSPVLLKHGGRKLKPSTDKSQKIKSKRKILLLGSSHGRGIGPMLQENLGAKFDIL